MLDCPFFPCTFINNNEKMYKLCTSKTGEMIISNDRYAMSESENSLYAVQMVLVIRKIKKSDIGGFKCISKNR